MSVRCGTHCPIFRIFLKNCLKIRHIFIDQILYRNNDTLLCISEQVVITHTCIKQSIRQITKLRQCQILLVRELV